MNQSQIKELKKELASARGEVKELKEMLGGTRDRLEESERRVNHWTGLANAVVDGLDAERMDLLSRVARIEMRLKALRCNLPITTESVSRWIEGKGEWKKEE
jgi:predicted  nucleic acid-binding Zn-ribbon protein